MKERLDAEPHAISSALVEALRERVPIVEVPEFWALRASGRGPREALEPG